MAKQPTSDLEVRVACCSHVLLKCALLTTPSRSKVKAYPIVPGIDIAGVVSESKSPLFKPGDEVVLTGNKTAQLVDGGYSQKAAVQAEWLAGRNPLNNRESARGR